MALANLENLHKTLNYLKESFVGKEQIIDMLGICLVAQENVFLFGPPGTAKSAIVRQLSRCIKDGKNFEYLLTRFTEPNEIFGPFDIRALKEGNLVTNVEGMMPEASLVFLDEIFNANSAILNSLLLALNEKIFRRGKETKNLPALMFVGASNNLPEDEALAALLDRFLIRVRCDYVAPDLLHQVLIAGKKIENETLEAPPKISRKEIIEWQKSCRIINLEPVLTQYVSVIQNLRNTGIKVSDRRAVKLQNLIAASALLSGREEANISDFWILKFIWDSEEQIEILAGIINTLIDQEDSDKPHPQANQNRIPNAEELLKEVEILIQKWNNKSLSFDEKNVIKDKLRYAQSRCDWLNSNEQKEFVQEKIDGLWKNILTEV